LVPSAPKDGFLVALNEVLRGKESCPTMSSIDLNRSNWS
jgi:hypothetical protein